jgi:hypothetical protein
MTLGFNPTPTKSVALTGTVMASFAQLKMEPGVRISDALA